MLNLDDDSDSDDSDEDNRVHVPPPSANDEKKSFPPAQIDEPSTTAPRVGPQRDAHQNDDGSHITPSHDTDPLKHKGNKHSSLLEEAKDIPAEVVAATMEAGRRRKYIH